MSILATPAMAVGTTIAGQSAKVRKQLEGLIKTVNKNTFDIGELLSSVKHGGHYTPEFNTFQEYVATLDIKPRKAQYLMRIVDVMAAVGVERQKYEPLGTAKLREITSLDSAGTWTNPDTKEQMPLKDFIVSFIDTGGAMELGEVKEHVRTLKGLVGDNDLVWINCCMKRAVKESTVIPAFELARRNLGSKGKDDEGVAVEYSDGACLEVVAAEYLNDPANNVLAEEAH